MSSHSDPKLDLSSKVPFKISYGWVRRETPYQFPEEYAEHWPPLFCHFRRFSAAYEGWFTLTLNEIDLDFDFDSDLSIVFEELPDLLNRLSTDTPSPVGLDFASQGSDLVLMLRRVGHTICIDLQVGSDSGQRFQDLAETGFLVDARRFLSEWVTFLRAILDAIKDAQPEVMDDHDFKQYLEQLSTIDTDSLD